jgi:DMSO/TMAO reductase YedYZ molybdopterin-dependent catalytic subunit
VLSAGPTPDVALEDWDLTVVDESGAVVGRWGWEAFLELPAEDVTVDIHCVTEWSKLGTRWQGVSMDTILSDEDEPGFCEGVGYHNYGDPWREQRYWGD